jgi:hypothetical protein
VDRYAWLLSPDGLALLERVIALTEQGIPDLRIAEQLRASSPADRVALAMTQRDLREKARAKFGQADQLYFTREGLEQATSDRIATHRASRFHSRRDVIDLCSGIGGDLMALSLLPGVEDLAAVDLDPVHLMLAAANVAAIAPRQTIRTIQSDVRDVDLSSFDGVFIDPARRSAAGRLGGILSEPPLEWAISLAEGGRAVGIKTAPGIPHHLVPAGWELELIAIGPDLKEAVLWSPAFAESRRTATVIGSETTHQLREIPGAPVSLTIPNPGQWLIDPNPAVTRAGLVEDLARQLGAMKIDEEIAFLVGNGPIETPLARALPIIEALPWHEKHLKSRLRELDAGAVDIRRRGLAGDVDKITKRLRGKGSRRLAIAMTRVAGEPWAIVCDIA